VSSGANRLDGVVHEYVLASERVSAPYKDTCTFKIADDTTGFFEHPRGQKTRISEVLVGEDRSENKDALPAENPPRQINR
jgi:hypothetical protein